MQVKFIITTHMVPTEVDNGVNILPFFDLTHVKEGHINLILGEQQSAEDIGLKVCAVLRLLTEESD